MTTDSTTTFDLNDIQIEIRDKFTFLEEDTSRSIFERQDEIHTAILAILSRRHHFQLGPPGVAKSLLVEEILARIGGLNDDDYFKWLLTKFTVPEELFGGPNFLLLRETGAYKRVTDKKLPRARFAFLDETYKGSSSILNALLKLMNEREFDNLDDDPQVPLLSMFGASNELPATQELDALADRFTFYHQVPRLRDMGSFMSMIGEHHERPVCVNLDDIYEAQQIVSQVEVPDDVREALWELRSSMHENDILVSDRRLFQAVAVVQAEAFMNGRIKAQVIDTKPLQHVMWRDPSHIDMVRKIVLDLADPLEREALDLLMNLNIAYEAFLKSMKDTNSQQAQIKSALEFWEKVKLADKEIASLKKREKDLGRKCPAITRINARRNEVAKVLLEKGMGVDPSVVASED